MQRKHVLREFEDAKVIAKSWRGAMEQALIDCVKADPAGKGAKLWLSETSQAFTSWLRDDLAAHVSTQIYIDIDRGDRASSHHDWRTFRVFSAHCNKMSGAKYRAPYSTQLISKDKFVLGIVLWLRRTKCFVFSTKELKALFEMNLLCL